MRFSFLLLILISMFFVNACVAQNNFSNSNKFKMSFIQNLNSQIREPHFKITLSDSWLGRDKVHHFLTSAFLSGVGYYFFHEEQHYSNRVSQRGGFCFSISLGLAKEVRDGLKKENAFSVKDLAADILGTLAGIALVSDL
jgi:putative lipoprotein